MSYRDDLGQAHHRIEELERELREEREKATAARAPVPKPRGSRVTRIVMLVVGLAAGAAAIAVGALSMRPRSKPKPIVVVPVDVLVKNKSHYAGARLRVHGLVVANSTVKRTEPCEVDFMLEHGGYRVPVHYLACVLPETYREGPGIEVTAEGTLDDHDVFVAKDVLAKLDTSGMSF